MEDGLADGLGVQDALALAVCFGSVVFGGLCWLKRSRVRARGEGKGSTTRQSRDVAMKKDPKHADIGLEDLENALKEAEQSEIEGSQVDVEPTGISSGASVDDMADLDLAVQELEDVEKILDEQER
uniref:Uncharacterized protein n=1 Tax=Lotharella oceanica TaxID=641309 RepID=A0A7S2U3D3_9EUKA|mmetsp:Transcript_6299/g.12536  ORF Transcript_6299/g.12536 Transcript_6299/m.12536 type:complete len:126 (+) Transcript_6299:66-443(+)